MCMKKSLVMFVVPFLIVTQSLLLLKEVEYYWLFLSFFPFTFIVLKSLYKSYKSILLLEIVIKLLSIDWACGGQWNRMVSFLAQFVSSLQKANIDLVVFFNGCTEPQRMAEWIASQQRTRQRVNQVINNDEFY